MRGSRFEEYARPLPVLLALSGLALLIRLVGLGARVAHQDEARVAHWTLHYMDVGAWEYRAIIHGPFIPHVNGVVFDLLGPSDFTMRLVVAVVGGLLPLAAWLLRDRLRDLEIVLLGALLALNPVLIYYSRFMRNDLLLGAFAFAAFAFVVRAMDTGQGRYLLAAAVAFGLAATTKENVLLYLLTWGGALVLLLDQRLFHARFRGKDWVALARAEIANGFRGVWRARYPVGGGVLTVVVIVLAFYSPKPDLYQALANPAKLPGVLDAATLGTWEKFTKLWGSTGMQEHSYVKFLGHLLLVMAVGGITTTVFAGIGFVADRYREAGPRDVVAFAFYWGLASVLGYPIVSDIMAGWTAVHALVPLAVPGAVGLSVVARTARDAIAADDGRVAAVTVVLLVLGATATLGGGVAVNVLYPTEKMNPVVQYAQPAGDMKPTLAEIEGIAAENEGVDVVFYGEEYYTPNETGADARLDIETGGYAGWFARLPLPWYLEIYDANVTSTKDPDYFEDHQPPVVITLREETPTIRPDLQDYRSVTHQGYLSDRPVVFYIKESAAT